MGKGNKIKKTPSSGDFPGGSDGKASTYTEGDLGSIPGSGRSPEEGNGNPLQYSWPPPEKKRGSKKFFWRRKWQSTAILLPRKVHGWRSLVGYSPWGCKESDTTEQLHFLFLVQEKLGTGNEGDRPLSTGAVSLGLCSGGMEMVETEEDLLSASFPLLLSSLAGLAPLPHK